MILVSNALKHRVLIHATPDDSYWWGFFTPNNGVERSCTSNTLTEAQNIFVYRIKDSLFHLDFYWPAV